MLLSLCAFAGLLKGCALCWFKPLSGMGAAWERCMLAEAVIASAFVAGGQCLASLHQPLVYVKLWHLSD
jgi:hypothetical protein